MVESVLLRYYLEVHESVYKVDFLVVIKIDCAGYSY